MYKKNQKKKKNKKAKKCTVKSIIITISKISVWNYVFVTYRNSNFYKARGKRRNCIDVLLYAKAIKKINQYKCDRSRNQIEMRLQIRFSEVLYRVTYGCSSISFKYLE